MRAVTAIGGLSRGLGLVAAVVALSAAGVLAWGAAFPPPPPLPDLGPAPEFEMAGADGRTVRGSDLRGLPWIADFIFTRCGGPCPVLSAAMASLQGELPEEVHLVSFSVDPDHDTPEVLTAYAAGYGARPGRWHFLTAPREEVFRTSVQGFRLGAEEGNPALDPGDILHSTRLTLVDARGRIRGYYDGTDPSEVTRLREDALRLPWPDPGTPAWVRRLPTLNAGINATVSLLLLAGLVAVRTGHVGLHKACMLSSVALAAVFLASYLTYHFKSHILTSFTHGGWARPLYYTVLLSHTALAATALPLILVTLRRALRGDLERHRRAAGWAYPVWLYVSVTGVAVYVLLYVVYPPL